MKRFILHVLCRPIVLWVIVMVFILGTCAGCETLDPKLFAEVELGYGVESGNYAHIDERGCRGNFAFGLEMNDTKWYHPTEVGYRHTSQCYKSPEVVLDQFYIKKRIGGQ